MDRPSNIAVTIKERLGRLKAGSLCIFGEWFGGRPGENHHTIVGAESRWEWYCYGRKKSKDNRYFLEYTREGVTVRGTTNVDWYQHTFATVPNAPAVEIV